MPQIEKPSETDEWEADKTGSAEVTTDADGRWVSINIDPPESRVLLVDKDYLLALVRSVYPDIAVTP